MFECRPPVATLSAGATTRARSAGPTSGTAICRGLCAVRAALRDASVHNARTCEVRRGSLTRGAKVVGWAIAVAIVLVLPLFSGSCDEVLAGQPQVDVIEGGLAGADRAGAQPCPVDRADRLTGARVVQRDGDRLSDG